MDMTEITLLLGAAGGMAGIAEGIKVWINRKTERRTANATAATTETAARSAEFDLLARHNEFLQHALSEESARFTDQTRRLRETQDELAAVRAREAEKDLRLAHLSMWRCEHGDCQGRRPPQPLLQGRKFSDNQSQQ